MSGSVGWAKRANIVFPWPLHRMANNEWEEEQYNAKQSSEIQRSATEMRIVKEPRTEESRMKANKYNAAK